MADESWITGLAQTVVKPPQSAVERVVDALRTYITEGRVRPGTRLSEEALSSALEVSRNTLREAFRVLAHERLLVHHVNRGMFVHDPSRDDVVADFGLRRILELSALQMRERHTPERIAAMRAAVDAGASAAAVDDWAAVGTANMRFHLAVAGLAGNVRVDEAMSRVLAETRLAFHRRPADVLHRPYLPLNRRICEAVERGDADGAAAQLAQNLDLAEAELLATFCDR